MLLRVGPPEGRTTAHVSSRGTVSSDSMSDAVGATETLDSWMTESDSERLSIRLLSSTKTLAPSIRKNCSTG